MNAPEGWALATLGSKCSIEIGGTPSRGANAYWDTDGSTDNAWVSIKDMHSRLINDTAERISDLGVRHSNVKLQPKGTLLLSFKLTIGRVAFAGVPLYTNEAIAGLQSKTLDSEYLYHGLQQWDLLQGVDQAIKGATLNKAKLRKISFNHPESRAEQSKIAEVLSTVDRAMAQTEALIAKQQRIKTGLMQDLLTRGIDGHGQLRSEATHAFKDSPLGRIPVEWDVCSLERAVRSDSPITYGVVQPGKEDEYGVLFVRGGDIYQGEISISKLRTISKAVSAPYRRTLLEGGELLMSLVGYPGEVAVVPETLAGANIARQAALIRLSDHFAPAFVMCYLLSSDGKRQVLGSSLGSAQQVVNLKDLRTVVVPMPDEVEQSAIAERVAELFSQQKKTMKALNKLRSLKTALMQDLLTGKVRVTPLLPLAGKPTA
ncbi:restriction endonuclease subunit S [Rhodanobacter umsongensis]|uniref:Restriction endonuclease subunit S n=1 Tax=Rhodanobacter umsongensis TaxID=633153 RepID=A0ABW0JH97_9GAMM